MENGSVCWNQEQNIKNLETSSGPLSALLKLKFSTSWFVKKIQDLSRATVPLRPIVMSKKSYHTLQIQLWVKNNHVRPSPVAGAASCSSSYTLWPTRCSTSGDTRSSQVSSPALSPRYILTPFKGTVSRDGLGFCWHNKIDQGLSMGRGRCFNFLISSP